MDIHTLGLNFEFHHIGIAVRSIQATATLYAEAGYHATNSIFDPIQNVNIAFLQKAGSPLLELVEPVDKTAPCYGILKKVGVSPYHFCYEVNDMQYCIEKLKEKDFKTIVEPVNAIAFNNRKICFLYHIDVGLIELLCHCI
jgi:methylmalonyl-CoA/ethylmalonyl-CoA epimerase